jgi:hypothetical protein
LSTIFSANSTDDTTIDPADSADISAFRTAFHEAYRKPFGPTIKTAIKTTLH